VSFIALIRKCNRTSPV